jgi:hypothetical protein
MKQTKQWGGSLVGNSMMVIAVIFLLMIIFKIVPIYMEHMSVTDTLKVLSEEPQLVNAQANGITSKLIQERVQRQFMIKDVTSVDLARNVSVTRAEVGKGLVLRVAYEVRKPLMGNLSLVVEFDDSITLAKQ